MKIMGAQIAWQQFNPVRIIQGEGSLNRIAEWVLPGEVLLVTSPGFSRRGITRQVLRLITNPVTVYDQVMPNPDIDSLDAAVDKLRGKNFSSVIALGGGSAIDSGKAFASALTNGRASFLHSVLRDGSIDLPNTCLNLVAIPTTAGTGAEATFFATIWDHKNNRKMSLSGEILFPRVALLDPLLHLTLPRQETIYSALDCISHALETIWNKNRTPFSESIATRALTCSLSALPRVINNPHDIKARQEMMIASTFAGIAISQNYTALAHSISYPLTIYFSVPHGLAAGFTLNAIIRFLRENDFFRPDGNLDKQIVRLEKMLRSFKLNLEITKYVSLDKAVQKIPEMFTPDRLNNFVYTISADDVRSILKDSF